MTKADNADGSDAEMNAGAGPAPRSKSKLAEKTTSKDNDVGTQGTRKDKSKPQAAPEKQEHKNNTSNSDNEDAEDSSEADGRNNSKKKGTKRKTTSKRGKDEASDEPFSSSEEGKKSKKSRKPPAKKRRRGRRGNSDSEDLSSSSGGASKQSSKGQRQSNARKNSSSASSSMRVLRNAKMGRKEVGQDKIVSAADMKLMKSSGHALSSPPRRRSKQDQTANKLQLQPDKKDAAAGRKPTKTSAGTADDKKTKANAKEELELQKLKLPSSTPSKAKSKTKTQKEQKGEDSMDHVDKSEKKKSDHSDESSSDDSSSPSHRDEQMDGHKGGRDRKRSSSERSLSGVSNMSKKNPVRADSLSLSDALKQEEDEQKKDADKKADTTASGEDKGNKDGTDNMTKKVIKDTEMKEQVMSNKDDRQEEDNNKQGVSTTKGREVDHGSSKPRVEKIVLKSVSRGRSQNLNPRDKSSKEDTRREGGRVNSMPRRERTKSRDESAKSSREHDRLRRSRAGGDRRVGERDRRAGGHRDGSTAGRFARRGGRNHAPGRDSRGRGRGDRDGGRRDNFRDGRRRSRSRDRTAERRDITTTGRAVGGRGSTHLGRRGPVGRRRSRDSPRRSCSRDRKNDDRNDKGTFRRFQVETDSDRDVLGKKSRKGEENAKTKTVELEQGLHKAHHDERAGAAAGENKKALGQEKIREASSSSSSDDEQSPSRGRAREKDQKKLRAAKTSGKNDGEEQQAGGNKVFSFTFQKSKSTTSTVAGAAEKNAITSAENISTMQEDKATKPVQTEGKMNPAYCITSLTEQVSKQLEESKKAAEATGVSADVLIGSDNIAATLKAAQDEKKKPSPVMAWGSPAVDCASRVAVDGDLWSMPGVGGQQEQDDSKPDSDSFAQNKSEDLFTPTDPVAAANLAAAKFLGAANFTPPAATTTEVVLLKDDTTAASGPTPKHQLLHAEHHPIGADHSTSSRKSSQQLLKVATAKKYQEGAAAASVPDGGELLGEKDEMQMEVEEKENSPRAQAPAAVEQLDQEEAAAAGPVVHLANTTEGKEVEVEPQQEMSDYDFFAPPASVVPADGAADDQQSENVAPIPAEDHPMAKSDEDEEVRPAEEDASSSSSGSVSEQDESNLDNDRQETSSNAEVVSEQEQQQADSQESDAASVKSDSSEGSESDAPAENEDQVLEEPDVDGQEHEAASSPASTGKQHDESDGNELPQEEEQQEEVHQQQQENTNGAATSSTANVALPDEQTTGNNMTLPKQASPSGSNPFRGQGGGDDEEEENLRSDENDDHLAAPELSGHEEDEKSNSSMELEDALEVAGTSGDDYLAVENKEVNAVGAGEGEILRKDQVDESVAKVVIDAPSIVEKDEDVLEMNNEAAPVLDHQKIDSKTTELCDAATSGLSSCPVQLSEAAVLGEDGDEYETEKGAVRIMGAGVKALEGGHNAEDKAEPEEVKKMLEMTTRTASNAVVEKEEAAVSMKVVELKQAAEQVDIKAAPSTTLLVTETTNKRRQDDTEKEEHDSDVVADPSASTASGAAGAVLAGVEDETKDTSGATTTTKWVGGVLQAGPVLGTEQQEEKTTEAGSKKQDPPSTTTSGAGQEQEAQEEPVVAGPKKKRSRFGPPANSQPAPGTMPTPLQIQQQQAMAATAARFAPVGAAVSREQAEVAASRVLANKAAATSCATIDASAASSNSLGARPPVAKATAPGVAVTNKPQVEQQAVEQSESVVKQKENIPARTESEEVALTSKGKLEVVEGSSAVDEDTKCAASSTDEKASKKIEEVVPGGRRVLEVQEGQHDTKKLDVEQEQLPPAAQPTTEADEQAQVGDEENSEKNKSSDEQAHDLLAEPVPSTAPSSASKMIEGTNNPFRDGRSFSEVEGEQANAFAAGGGAPAVEELQHLQPKKEDVDREGVEKSCKAEAEKKVGPLVPATASSCSGQETVLRTEEESANVAVVKESTENSADLGINSNKKTAKMNDMEAVEEDQKITSTAANKRPKSDDLGHEPVEQDEVNNNMIPAAKRPKIDDDQKENKENAASNEQVGAVAAQAGASTNATDSTMMSTDGQQQFQMHMQQLVFQNQQLQMANMQMMMNPMGMVMMMNQAMGMDMSGMNMMWGGQHVHQPGGGYQSTYNNYQGGSYNDNNWNNSYSNYNDWDNNWNNWNYNRKGGGKGNRGPWGAEGASENNPNPSVLESMKHPINQNPPANRANGVVNMKCARRWERPDSKAENELLRVDAKNRFAVAMQGNPVARSYSIKIVENLQHQLKRPEIICFFCPVYQQSYRQKGKGKNGKSAPPEGHPDFKYIGDNVDAFVESLEEYMYPVDAGGVAGSFSKDFIDKEEQYSQCRGQLHMRETKLNDESFEKLIDFFLRKKIQISVWRIDGNLLTTLDPLIKYIKQWKEMFPDQEMKFHEVHCHNNYLTRKGAIDFITFLLEEFKQAPARDDWRYHHCTKFRPLSIDTNRVPIWIRIGDNDCSRNEPEQTVLEIDALHKKYSDETNSTEAICYVGCEECTHLCCRRFAEGISPIVHVNGLTSRVPANYYNAESKNNFGAGAGGKGGSSGKNGSSNHFGGDSGSGAAGGGNTSGAAGGGNTSSSGKSSSSSSSSSKNVTQSSSLVPPSSSGATLGTSNEGGVASSSSATSSSASGTTTSGAAAAGAANLFEGQHQQCWSGASPSSTTWRNYIGGTSTDIASAKMNRSSTAPGPELPAQMTSTTPVSKMMMDKDEGSKEQKRAPICQQFLTTFYPPEWNEEKQEFEAVTTTKLFAIATAKIDGEQEESEMYNEEQEKDREQPDCREIRNRTYTSKARIEQNTASLSIDEDDL
ncbi:unnamed protein product [Amoebophrya sp. A120]|nr:unnamed protein product [Amoebophrya sp. A120]|eukprot:GSA120T00018259001.1